MKEPRQQQQTLLDDEATLVVSGEETTLVAPRFDDEETLVARPVVPLDADAPPAAPEREAAPPAHARRRPYAPRRPWLLTLMAVSVLVGGVLGGAGLYLYQRQSQDPAVTPQQQPAAPADAAQAPAAEVRQSAPNPEPAARQTETTTAAAPNAAEPAAAPAREPENVPAVERRAAPSDGGKPVTPRRGKKGERDEEIERHAPPPSDGNVARAAQPEARRVDSIFYRPRRAERRARRGDDVDRLRRIFEGTPQ
jgi:hypothetical protein